ncbi:MAG: hypothetical protein ABC579_07230, partial [Candidatus Methanosuratincola petrocarbonis]
QRDVKAAKCIGMRAAYAQYGDCNFFETRDERPDYFLRSPMDLINILEGGAGDFAFQQEPIYYQPLQDSFIAEIQAQRRS